MYCSFPNQVMDMGNRKYSDRDNGILLLISLKRVTSKIKYERALSGRAGILPHMHGSLNTDAVVSATKLVKGT